MISGNVWVGFEYWYDGYETMKAFKRKTDAMTWMRRKPTNAGWARGIVCVPFNDSRKRDKKKSTRHIAARG